MLGFSRGERDILVAVVIVKILLFPAYRSTDFEVHRNWLAITSNLRLSRWYFDTTSEWTLDYPPFFAYFSYLLALPARLILEKGTANEILQLSRLPVETWATVLYMRMTVLISELVLLFGVLRLAEGPGSGRYDRIIGLSIAMHPGFLILDSIHFQYNAFLFGLMAWSLVGAKESKPVLCAGAFATLLMFKHIYVYLAPAWFVYLLRAYCFPPGSSTLNIPRLTAIGVSTIVPFALALGPFIYLGQLDQLGKRLFPFTRGLMHAYWAPNVWATIALVDRLLLKLSTRLTFLKISATGIASTSRGLVGDTNFAILPDIKPVECFILTGLTQVTLLTELWQKPTYKTFLRSIAQCGFASFMFGWHVHEKAVMLVLVPLSLLATEDWNHFRAWLIASVAGIYSLFPLLFNAAETPVKLGYSLIWLGLVYVNLRRSVTPPLSTMTNRTITWLETIYLSAFPALQLGNSLVPLLIARDKREKWEFLPLMVTSVWCSLGLMWSWARLCWASATAMQTSKTPGARKRL
ncbi:hypothetical protein FFLO_01250 [Filobasidium floriforme]|uniref:Alpha-1,3-glucosyltransferase n=1 Tax=Filobasidium floriforme TaxID=5210 RepID=A0A8K0JR03_9TREE|nr:hypothetical protein FFLO_01250 [Filobasidium floriforme]